MKATGEGREISTTMAFVRILNTLIRDNQDAILIPFEFNTDQAYILEFTNLCMRIIKDGALVTNASQAITAITKANPAVVTSAVRRPLRSISALVPTVVP